MRRLGRYHRVFGPSLIVWFICMGVLSFALDLTLQQAVVVGFFLGIAAGIWAAIFENKDGV